uniref:Putative secreted protein n=1 Tax=Ixodes ricinus TaxID=34613 RepID=A0A6B0TW78_IXORI
MSFFVLCIGSSGSLASDQDFRQAKIVMEWPLSSTSVSLVSGSYGHQLHSRRSHASGNEYCRLAYES